MLIAPLLLTLGCGGLPPLPQRPQPIPYADTLPIEPPREREFFQTTRLVKQSVGGELGYAFSSRRWLGREHEALNLTHYDDVVSSAWFERRNPYRRMSPAEVARGPTGTAPDTRGTLTIIAGKAQGISPGFTVTDASGQTFLLKFDPQGSPHLASAAGVISNRLFFAAGYHTPEDFIVVFDTSRLVLDPEAEIAVGGRERPMTVEDIANVLALTDPLPDGRFLALASKFVPGRPLGPFLFSGVRSDDPNDHYDHEHRRELRGLYVVSSWLNHVDMRFENTLDVFIDPPGYVRHYLIDFAGSLGSGTIRPHVPREGQEYNFDLFPTLGRVLTAGFYREGWETMEPEPIHPAIGWLPAEAFEPDDWKPNWPNPAFSRRTVRDNYWGAKLVASFTDDQIAAAVGTGGLPEDAARELTAILVQRRDKLVAHWFGRVTPIEAPSAATRLREGEAVVEVEFDDLGLSTELWEPETTRYRWRFRDLSAELETSGSSPAGTADRQRLRIVLPRLPEREPSSAGNHLAILEVTALRPDASERPATIYLRPDGHGYAVVGLKH